MQIYGYRRDDESQTLMEMAEISFQGDVDELRRVAQFLVSAAAALEQHGEVFGHEHLKYGSFGFAQDGPDVVVVRPS